MSATSPKIYVAVVGVGVIGSELINQLLAITPQVSLFNLISLSSSTRTIFDANENPSRRAHLIMEVLACIVIPETQLQDPDRTVVRSCFYEPESRSGGQHVFRRRCDARKAEGYGGSGDVLVGFDERFKVE